MMRAILVEETGGPERLVERDLPLPAPGRGEVAIHVAYAAANWGDTQKREGVYPNPVTYPVVLGLEVAGRVAAVGPGVRRFKVGDRVAAITGPSEAGGYAERCVAGQEFVIPLPDAISFEPGAAFPVVALTAWHLVNSAANLKPGETVLVHSIGGGVGLALTQIAVAKGVTVIGTVGSAGKGAKALGYGASRVIDRSSEDFVQAAMEFTGGRGVDAVIDSLGADILERSFDTLRLYGRIVNIGEAAGYPKFDIRMKLYQRCTSLMGFELLNNMREPARWRRGLREVVEAVASGRLDVPVAGVYELSDARAMHRALETRSISGKLLLRVAGDA